MGSIQSSFNQLFSSLMGAATIGKHFYKESLSGKLREETKEADILAKSEENLANTINALAEAGESVSSLEVLDKIRGETGVKAQESLANIIGKDPSMKNIEKYRELSNRPGRRYEEHLRRQYLEKQRAKGLPANDEERLQSLLNSKAPSYSSKYLSDNDGFIFNSPKYDIGHQKAAERYMAKRDAIDRVNNSKSFIKDPHDRGLIPSSINRKIKETVDKENTNG